MRKVIVLLLLLGTLASLCACQPTPEKPIVVQKDTERMIEQAADEENGTRLSDLDIPQGRYSFESAGLDGRLRIKVDADISVSNTDSMPIIKTSIGGFSQEMVTDIFNYLFPDEKPLGQVDGRTKAEIEKIILQMQQQLADGSYVDQGFTEEEYRDRITQMQADYETAPDTLPERSVSDGTMQKRGITVGFDVSANKELKADFLELNAGIIETQRFISVVTPDPDMDLAKANGFGSHLSYWKVSTNYTTQGMARTDGMIIPDIAKGKLTIPYEEAKALCDGFFLAAGLSEDFFMGASFVVDDRGTGFGEINWVSGIDIEGPKEPAKNYAYRFYYTRKAFGIPIALNTKGGGDAGEDFSFPWGYEFVSFIIDNDGIADIMWSNPIAVDSIVQENTILKPFDEIMSIFETMMRVTHEAFLNIYGQTSEMEIAVQDVQLCLLRIRERNGNDTEGLLVPAWVFYGNNIVIGDDGEISYDVTGGSASSISGPPFTLLAVNAIDGSIIDVSKGY